MNAPNSGRNASAIGDWYVDPGKHQHALAAFVGGVLIWCDFVPAHSSIPNAHVCVSLTIEKDVLVPGDPIYKANDLIDVNMAGADLAARIHERGGPKAEFVTQLSWKGQQKKPHHHKSIWRCLRPEERWIITRSGEYKTPQELEAYIQRACENFALKGKVERYHSKVHNLLDACGLGCHTLGRLGPAGAAIR